MTDKLKPVPCGCGGEAKIETVTTHFEQRPRFRIRCEKCNISTIWDYWNEAEAIEAWNRAMGADRGLDEWCTDCKEYDQTQHCCHRWSKVIKQTVKEVKAQYTLEYPKIIHCEDCKFYTPMNRELKTGICSLTMHHLGDEGFCSDAEMRGDDE